MNNSPRLAVGTVQPAVDPLPIVWALGQVLRQHGLQTQLFHSQARLAPFGGGRVVCGLTARYLDSWMMTPQLCLESFAHGVDGADLALILGQYCPAAQTALSNGTAPSNGGDLESLCNWLDAPKLAVLDVEELSSCRLPAKPRGTAGLLLDRVSPADLSYAQTTLEALWGVPVLGALECLPAVRASIAELARQDTPSDCVCEALASALAENVRLRPILQIAAAHPLPKVKRWVFRPRAKLAGLRVAVAYDQVFEGYFPDVLDLLELNGAVVNDFSPLRDEGLPDKSDVVYIGCGVPDRYARELSENHCLKLALRDHVRQGGWLYAEGGGLAYLCGQLCLPSGEQYPMTGILPAVAVCGPDKGGVEPSEVTLARDQWLAPAGSKLRGYRDPSCRIDPVGPLRRYVAERGHEMDLVGTAGVIGSRLQLDFAAQPDFLSRFATSPGPLPKPSPVW